MKATHSSVKDHHRIRWLLIIWSITLLINCYNSYSQEVISVDKWMDYIEEIAEESEENPESIEKLYNDLSYLSENPLNLNRITAEQLKQIPFLSDIQILNILDYLKKQGEFVSIYELKNIRFLDVETIELILPFIYVGEIDKTRPFTIKNLLKFGTNEFLLRYDRCLNEKKGYKELPDSILQQYPNRKYVGEPFYTSLRYSYSFDNRLQVGVVAEKDAGEAFWNSYNKGYDFYSVHALLKDLGTIRTLAIGDYKISFGQGLVISNDFTPSRSSILSQAERRNNGFRRHYSTNENDFFRGVASTLSVGKFDVSAFYSNRKADATADEYTISSFKTDGLHRTEGDLEKKRNIRIETIGGNIRYVSPRFLIGVTALTYSFGGLSVEPELKPYNIFYFRGKRNTNIGMDYTWRHRQLVFFGETALSENSALATLNAFQWSASSGLKAIILHRHYDRKYQAFCGNAFSQNSTVQNEDGLYISMQWAPFAYWRFSGYADFFRFPWIKYGIDAPSSGQEYMIQTDFNRIRNTTISARYRFRQREKNVTGENEVMILPADQHRVRLQITHKPSGIMIFRTSIEGNIYDDNKSSSNRGWVISQSIGWKKTNSPVQADMYAAYFHTDDYNSRVYSNEKNMLYSFYIPSFYGEGIRLSTVLRYNFTKKLYVSVKAAWAHYYDREIISSGLEEIEGRDKIDLYAQLRWKF
ncbi:MAG: helix-hairpin-helix domain-containing protein [Tannerella sp.]|nr:helix-hairpin-helix domain-containing protein [Tannerella sp.]